MTYKHQIAGILFVNGYEVSFINNLPELKSFEFCQAEPDAVYKDMQFDGSLESKQISESMLCDNGGICATMCDHYVWLYYKNEEEKELLYKFLDYVKGRFDFPIKIRSKIVMMEVVRFSIKKALGLPLDEKIRSI